MILFILFLIIYLIYLFKYQIGNRSSLFLIWINLFLISIFRNETNVFDYLGYCEIYDNIIIGNYVLIEPTFYTIAQISYRLLGGISALFFIYSILSIIPKYFLFNKISINPIQSLILYTSNFFILHDLTQIRISVAIVFFLISIFFIYRMNAFRYLILNVFGYLFHYSFVLYSVLFFFRNIKLSKYIYIVIIIIGYILYQLKISFFDFLLNFQTGNIINIKANQYISLLNNNYVNLYNPVFLFRIVIFLFFLFRIKNQISFTKYSTLFLNYYFFGIVLYIYMWKFPAFAGRFSEMFFILEIFIIPQIIIEIKNSIIRDSIVFFLSLFYLTLNVAYFNLLTF